MIRARGWIAGLAGLLVTGPVGWAQAKEKAPVVQLAILLDTSGSMDGLIDQARTQLWKIVNELAAAKRGGRSPVLQVALYEYGKSSLPAEQGYLRRILPFTTDLDKVSEELFKLRTDGGEEYCGLAIAEAVKGLSWSPDEKDLKLIFIAGNEPFNQGGTDFRASVKAAVAKGIAVNTIYCGAQQEGVRELWKQGAELGDGRYLNIDHSRPLARIPAPQDSELAKLNSSLNGTYVAFGEGGSAGRARQEAQDTLAAAAAPEVMGMRAAAKASSLYSADWDLVDAVKGGQVKLEDVKEADLPPELAKLDAGQRKAWLEAKAKERESVRARILKLSAERDAYVAAERKKQTATQGDSLDEAMIKAIREQASRKAYKF